MYSNGTAREHFAQRESIDIWFFELCAETIYTYKCIFYNEKEYIVA